MTAILALFSQPLQALGVQKETLASSQATAQNQTAPAYQHTTKEVIIKPATPIVVEKHEEPAPAVVVMDAKTREVVSGVKKQTDENLARTVTSNSLPFPKPPTKPNMLVGMTFSQDNKIIDNAIVEIIRTSDGTPMRALKTNLLGQFAIITPLESGEYEINVEKNGYHFDKTLLVLNNEVVQPLLIQAK